VVLLSLHQHHHTNLTLITVGIKDHSNYSTNQLQTINKIIMSEFKGTKGKWEIFRQDNDIYIETKNSNAAICCIVGGVGLNQDEANALLISKAPEMLEMLKVVAEFSNYINNDSGEGMIIDFQTFDEIIQLIKEATEL
jgi:hypothetical protein